MNYYVDTMGVRATRFGDFVPGLAVSIWPNPKREGKLQPQAGTWLWSMDCEAENRGGRVALLHWAGFSCSWDMPFRPFFLRARLAGCAPGERAIVLLGLLLKHLARLPFRMAQWMRGMVAEARRAAVRGLRH